MITFSKRIGDEIYIYVKGRLIMKRWLSTGVSVTFHTCPNGVRYSSGSKFPRSAG